MFHKPQEKSLGLLAFRFVLASASFHGVAAFAQNTPSIQPDTFVAGKSYTVVVKLPADSSGTCGDHNLQTPNIMTATGSGVTLAPSSTKTSDPCTWSGTLTVAQDAGNGDLSVVVQESKSITQIPIKVIAKAAGPIPPGLKPQVDIAWGVLPRRISADNFGARITKLYYPIEVVIGNNSGYDLQIASVQFQLACPEESKCEPKSDFPNVPSDSYYTVRTSLQHEQLIGFRNTTVNIVKAVGPILTGSAVFFNGSTAMALNHRKLFGNLTNVFSNPFEKGLELVFPDETVQQLVNLDNHALRDGLIISNNTQIRTIVFINKDILVQTAKIAPNGDEARKLGAGAFYERHEYDQQLVMRKLGSLQLIGREIAYLNRVSVISNPPGPGPQFTISPASIVQNDASIGSFALTLTGDGLAGGTLTASDPSIKITSPKASGDGKSFTATIDASSVAPGKYTFTLTASGAQSQTLEIKPAPIAIANPQPTPIALTKGDTGTTTYGPVTGKLLKNAKDLKSLDCTDVTLTLIPPTSDTGLTFNATVPASPKATSCTATVTDATGATQTFPLTFK